MLWVIAGRSVPIADGHSDSVEVSRLGEDEVSSWLMDETGSHKYALMSRDNQDRDETHRNPFIDVLTARSEGLPLYAACDRIKYGRLTVHDEANLPLGLQNYYMDLLARLHVGDEAQMLTHVLAVLLRSQSICGAP